jgi:hypothetical protein
MPAPRNPRGRAGMGRPKGSPNRATRELKALAQRYTAEALAVLADVMRDPDSPAAARVTAATALLDRGHGRPQQHVEHSGEFDSTDHAADARERLLAGIERLAAAQRT